MNTEKRWALFVREGDDWIDIARGSRLDMEKLRRTRGGIIVQLPAGGR